MNPWMWVLTALGILIGLILLIIIRLIFGKLRLIADYRKGELKIWVQWLFLKYYLYPDPDKEEEREERRAKKQAEKQKREHRKKPSVSLNKTEKEAKTSPSTAKKKPKRRKNSLRRATKREIRRAVQAVPLKEYAMCLRVIVTHFISKFHVKSLVIHASIGGDDAMDIATEYGTINALLYPVLGAISSAGRLHKCDIQITPDFTSEETHAEGRGVFTFRLIQAFGCIWELSNKLYE